MRKKNCLQVVVVCLQRTGKTLTCSAIMNQIESTIIYIKSDDIHERGQIAELYDIARSVAPTIMVIEDIDTLGGIDRTRGGDHPILGEFLNCLAVWNPIVESSPSLPQTIPNILTKRWWTDRKI